MKMLLHNQSSQASHPANGNQSMADEQVRYQEEAAEEIVKIRQKHEKIKV